MERKGNTGIWIVAAAIGCGIAGQIVYMRRFPLAPVVITGAVIRNDADPGKQAPVAKVRVTVIDGAVADPVESAASGYFQVTTRPFVRDRPILLKFEHADYRPLTLTANDATDLYVVRLEPLVTGASATPESGNADSKAVTSKPVTISGVRVRYSMKNQTTMTVGSVAKQFEVVNAGDVPCKGQSPCSPDGKWKAAKVTLPLDAGNNNEFRNVRVSCIAGPCPFTRLETGDLTHPTRKLAISALNWSDTAAFLVEAEVTRTMVGDTTRQAYPFVTGRTISFALPPSSEGPSIIADVNGEEIVFPLGPTLALSWTSCSVEGAAGGNQLYRCELKPGYQTPQ